MVRANILGHGAGTYLQTRVKSVTGSKRRAVMTYSVKQLREFISKKMAMSHIYQPVMLRTLISKGGVATTREIAAAFLGKDASQLEYYETITKRMPGKVLASHGLVEKTADGYRLLADIADMKNEQREELLRLCDQREAAYLERRWPDGYFVPA